MKKILTLVVLAAAMIMVSSCEKDDEPQQGILEIIDEHVLTKIPDTIK